MISAADAEAIEHATLQALPPRVLEMDDGWLLCANDGVVSRVNSVVPLHAGGDRLEAKIDRAIAFYEDQRVGAAFRVSPFSQPEDLSAALAARGFAPQEATVVMVADVGGVSLEAPDLAVRMVARPGEAWLSLFAGQTGKPEKARRRAETLARGQGTLFAEIIIADTLAAIGAISIDGAWAGVHGMRTAVAYRGRGLARALMRRLIAEAQVLGATSLYLQVEDANAEARRLYARSGFADAYRYDYWRRT